MRMELRRISLSRPNDVSNRADHTKPSFVRQKSDWLRSAPNPTSVPWMHVSSERIPKNPGQHRVFRHSAILFVWFPGWVVRESIKRGFAKMTSVVSGTGSSRAQQPADKTPISRLDPYSDRALIDPWPIYAELQDAGPAVWLSKYKMFALARYDSALKALQDPSSFPSSMGVMMNDHMNHILRGNTLCSDGEDHSRLRRIIMKPLTASALKHRLSLKK
jgi:hypothetical protein